MNIDTQADITGREYQAQGPSVLGRRGLHVAHVALLAVSFILILYRDAGEILEPRVARELMAQRERR